MHVHILLHLCFVLSCHSLSLGAYVVVHWASGISSLNNEHSTAWTEVNIPPKLEEIYTILYVSSSSEESESTVETLYRYAVIMHHLRYLVRRKAFCFYAMMAHKKDSCCMMFNACSPFPPFQNILLHLSYILALVVANDNNTDSAMCH